MKPKYFVAIVGAALIVIGMALGLSSSSVTDRGKTFGCGSPFASDTAQAAYQDQVNEIGATLVGGRKVEGSLVASCQDSFGSRGTIGWVLIGLGAVVVVGGLVVRVPARSQPA